MLQIAFRLIVLAKISEADSTSENSFVIQRMTFVAIDQFRQHVVDRVEIRPQPRQLRSWGDGRQDWDPAQKEAEASRAGAVYRGDVQGFDLAKAAALR